MDLAYSFGDIDRGLRRNQWKSWTPTLSDDAAGSPTITLAYANYLEWGDLTYFEVYCTITAVGGASGALLCTLPTTASEAAGTILGYGRENALSGKMLFHYLIAGNKTRVAAHNNVNDGVFVASYQLAFSGKYRTA